MKLMSIKRAAKETGVSESRLRKLIREREIPHVRYGQKTIRVELSDIHAWIAAQKTTEFTPGRCYNPRIGDLKKSREHSPPR